MKGLDGSQDNWMKHAGCRAAAWQGVERGGLQRPGGGVGLRRGCSWLRRTTAPGACREGPAAGRQEPTWVVAWRGTAS